MKFSEILYKHNRNKTALISDGTVYTYGMIISDIEKSKKSEKNYKGLVAICAGTIYEELIGFLSCETGIPFIAPSNAKIKETTNPDADFAIMSSGSSGIPKLMFRTTESWYSFFDEQNRVFNITENTTLFMNGSLCFSGNLNILLGAFYAGAAVVVDKGHLTRTRAENIRKCNAIYLIPDKLRLLCRLLHHQKEAQNIETVIAGSQSMGRNEADLLHQILGAKRVILYYGAAEISYISYIDILSERKDRSCIGKPFNGINIQFDNERLTVSSDFAALGIQMPYMMNDIIHADSEGYLYYDGRYDDVLNIGGEKISASALENELMRAGAAEDVCVFLKEGAFGRGVLCCAWCGMIEKEAALRAVHIPYMPKKWYRLDFMPKNSNGKTDRNEVIRCCEYKNSHKPKI